MEQKLTKIYTEILPSLEYLPLLYPNLGVDPRMTSLFSSSIFSNFKIPVVEIVDDPALAEYFLIPHNYFSLKKYTSYLDKIQSLALKYNKKIIIFAYGDSAERISLSNSIIFRTSKYVKELQKNEIIMPPYTEDLQGGGKFVSRIKSEKPTIGFCGWAAFSSFFKWFKFQMKVWHIDIKKFISGDISLEINKQGIYFRRKAIKIIQSSKKVIANIIVRTSYSANKKTISLEPEEARSQYIKNIIDSDFILAPKGDGNYSVRFYETLSLGRIPILIDTECILPLENFINYKEFVFFIDHEDIKDIDSMVYEFYNDLSLEQFQLIQQKAREVFVKFLRIDSFFIFFFTSEDGRRLLSRL